MSEDEVVELLRGRLSIEITSKSECTGFDPVNEEYIYQDRKMLQLLLDHHVISEVTL